MGNRQRCATHGYVDLAEMRAYGGVLVHMLDPWHVALTGSAVEMAGAEPLLEDGMPVVRFDDPRPPLDAEVEGPGLADG
jgi:hypothetical protein